MPGGAWVLPSPDSGEKSIFPWREEHIPGERARERGEPWPAELRERFQLLMGGQEVGPEQACNFAEARILIVCPAIVGGGPSPSAGAEPGTSVQAGGALCGGALWVCPHSS